MSDASDASDHSLRGVSLVSPLFAQAWSMVHNEDGTEKPTEDAEAAGAGGAATPPPAAEAPGGSGTPSAAEAQAGGASSASANPLAAAAAGTVPDPAASAAATAQPGGAEVPPGSAGVQVPDPARGVGTFKSDDAVPLFAAASQKMSENMKASFLKAATDEVRADIDPIFVQSIQGPATALVGQQLPSLAPNAKDDDKITITDTSMALQYQTDVKSLIEAEIKDVADRKEADVKPMLGVLQNSFVMFENNPDLIVGTDKFDYELAERVARVGKSFELVVNGKVVGYQVNMQPFITETRTQLAKERGATSVVQQQAQTAQQIRAAEQARTATGQFDAPQGGLTSKSNMSGGDSEEDMSAFWGATRFGQEPGLNL